MTSGNRRLIQTQMEIAEEERRVLERRLKFEREIAEKRQKFDEKIRQDERKISEKKHRVPLLKELATKEQALIESKASSKWGALKCKKQVAPDHETDPILPPNANDPILAPANSKGEKKKSISSRDAIGPLLGQAASKVEKKKSDKKSDKKNDKKGDKKSEKMGEKQSEKNERKAKNEKKERTSNKKATKDSDTKEGATKEGGMKGGEMKKGDDTAATTEPDSMKEEVPKAEDLSVSGLFDPSAMFQKAFCCSA